MISLYILCINPLLDISFCCCSVAQLCPTFRYPMDRSTRGPISPCAASSPRVCSNSCPLSQRCHPTVSSSVILFSSSIRVFSNESVLCIRWPKFWSFSISPSCEYAELISFTFDQFDLLAVQGTLRSLLQHHSSKASILQDSAFFMVQLSHPYMAMEKLQL